MTADWPPDEVSTRNCFNCLASPVDIYVSCRKGNALLTSRGDSPLAYNGVVRTNKLLGACRDCKGFDNNW